MRRGGGYINMSFLSVLWLFKFWLLGSLVSFGLVLILTINSLIQRWLVWLSISPEWVEAQVQAMEAELHIKVLGVKEFVDKYGFHYIGCLYKKQDDENAQGAGVCVLARFQYPREMLTSLGFALVQALLFSAVLSWGYTVILLLGMYKPELFQRSEDSETPQGQSNEEPKPNS